MKNTGALSDQTLTDRLRDRHLMDRARAEDLLREGEERFRRMADAAPVMIWMSGVDMRCTFFNKPWLEFTGRTMEQEVGNGWATGVHPQDLQHCLEMHAGSFKAGRPFTMEYRLRGADGAYRWVLDRGVPRYTPAGELAGYIGSAIDITERKLTADRLRTAQEELARVVRLSTMGQLAVAIAHEVKQPFSAIVINGAAALRLLDKNPPDLDEVREALKDIVLDGNRAAAVMESIRALMKKSEPQMNRVDINDAIRHVLALSRSELDRQQVSVQTDLVDELPPLLGDRVQLEQVILNLITNAAEAMQANTNRPRPLLIKSRAQDVDGVLVSVQDSGVGLDPRTLNRMFEIFFTTKPTGTGMGLSICRSIVEAHGGRLWASPAPHGAVIQFTIPAIAAGYRTDQSRHGDARQCEIDDSLSPSREPGAS